MGMDFRGQVTFFEIGSGFGEMGGNSMVHNYYNIYFFLRKTKNETSGTA